MTPEYLAGFIDGEGCLQFTKNRKSITPRIVITNTNLEILQLIQSLYGGCIYKQKKVDNWKQGYSLSFSARAALNLLHKVYPFLLIKKAQAEIILEYERNMPGRGVSWDNSLLASYKEKIHFLNKKGK